MADNIDSAQKMLTTIIISVVIKYRIVMRFCKRIAAGIVAYEVCFWHWAESFIGNAFWIMLSTLPNM